LAGTDLSRVDVPGLYKSIYTNPSHSLLCNASVLDSYSACTIGGCTAINAGLFFQPPSSDFDTYFPKQWKSADMASAISKLRATQPFTQDPSANGQFYVQSGYNAAKAWLVDGGGYTNVT
jgi:cellobiose dehydrogenase (acceptor)